MRGGPLPQLRPLLDLPPGCGTLEEISERAAAYRRGVLLQSTGQMEDDFDVEAMMDTERLQKERFRAFLDRVRSEHPDCLPCPPGRAPSVPPAPTPTRPAAFPGWPSPPWRPYGLVVSQVCQDSGLPYYYGPQTITYTACVLID